MKAQLVPLEGDAACRRACGRRATSMLLSAEGDELGAYCEVDGQIALTERLRHDARQARRLSERGAGPAARRSW